MTKVEKYFIARILVLLFLLVVALPSGCSSSTSTLPSSSVPADTGAAKPATQPAVVKGKSLFESRCAGCHGQLGEGGKAPDGSIATPLSTHLRAHAGLEGGVKQIVRAVLDGVHEEDGSTHVLGSAMPRFRDKLSESEVMDIISYMETLP